MSIYLDHAATTPLREEVRQALESVLGVGLGNPSSQHARGRRARVLLEDARERIAGRLGAAADEIVFVRGGTEGDNLAVLGRGLWALRQSQGPAPVAVVSAIEHPAVLEAASALARSGGGQRVLPVSARGAIAPEDVQNALLDRPSVLSVQWVNNETGLMPPLADLLGWAHAQGVVMHTDAVQAIGKVPVRVDELAVDLLTLTGHKFGGPMSAGVLFIRRGVDVEPLLFGGGQEGSLRPGTSDVAAAVGLSVALDLAVERLSRNTAHWQALASRLDAGVLALVPGRIVHGGEGPRAPHIHNLGLPGLDADALLAGLDLEGLAVSGGSACSSGSGRGSHVLEALYGPELDRAALRFSFGPDTSAEDIDGALAALARVLDRLGVG